MNTLTNELFQSGHFIPSLPFSIGQGLSRGKRGKKKEGCDNDKLL